MIGITPFYLPVIRRPEPLSITNPLAYYGAIADDGVTVTATVPAPGQPMQITVGNPEGVYHDDEEETPMSTVFAVTAGFVKYVPSTGEIELKVWGRDFAHLVKPAGGHRPNRIIFGSLDAGSIEAAIKNHIEKQVLSLPVLQSWTENEGDREVVELALAQRFMEGTASIFVEAGTPLGEGMPVDDTTTELTMATFFGPDGVDVPPEDLIDNALAGLRFAAFAGHPLINATCASVINVHFLSRFLIWDNSAFDYVPLANTEVTLLASAPVPSAAADLVPSLTVAPPIQTDNDGKIDLTVELPALAMIRFRYATANQTYGTRLYAKDVVTDAHKARLHLEADSTNTKDYKAKYEIYPEYQAFINDLADNTANEELMEDRGKATWQDKVQLLEIAENYLPDIPRVTVPPGLFTQRDRLQQISAFESFYKAEVLPPKANTFNLLVEGDSWLNYPLAWNDIYSHLDQIIMARLKPDIAYNRLPLQHLGDRAYHMFHSEAGKIRQWNFTEEFLKEYQIDMILCSAGGNDFAAPGIEKKMTLYEPFFVPGSDHEFDPYLAAAALSPNAMDAARMVMQQSFAVLLRNHPWNFFIRNRIGTQLDEVAMPAVLDPLLAAVGVDFGPTPGDLQALGIPPGPLSKDDAPTVLQPIGEKVIANFPDTCPLGSPEDALLQCVFDRTAGGVTGLYEQRFSEVKALWAVLLAKAGSLGIPVVSHTYGYPLFKEDPAPWPAPTGTGPWFNHRFREAKITDRRIQKICLKAILDNFVNEVLQPLKQQYPLFDYVDVRTLDSSVDFWRDEMHLKGKGYKKVAEQIYDVIAARFPNLFAP